MPWRRKISIQNGLIEIRKEVTTEVWKTYDESRITVDVRENQYLSELSISEKRMVIACFTGVPIPNTTEVNYAIQRASVDFYIKEVSFEGKVSYIDEVSIEGVKMLGIWDNRTYGPFPTNVMPVCFKLRDRNISTWMSSTCISLPIYIKQGNMLFPLLVMPIEEREFLFAEVVYSQFEIGNHMMIKIEEDKIVIERDYICVSEPGFTVLRRFLDATTTYFEIDYWSIKDPLLARFMRLMTAVYIKELKGIEFAARDNRLTHFIMKLDLEKGETLMAEATKVVYQRRHLLHSKLLECSNTDHVKERYSFSNPSLQPPSRKTVVNYIKNRVLIKAAYELLTSP